MIALSAFGLTGKQEKTFGTWTALLKFPALLCQVIFIFATKKFNFFFLVVVENMIIRFQREFAKQEAFCFEDFDFHSCNMDSKINFLYIETGYQENTSASFCAVAFVSCHSSLTSLNSSMSAIRSDAPK